MKRLLLINLPGESLRKPEEHCGLAALKAYANQNGYAADIFDAYALKISISDCKLWLDSWLKNNSACEKYIGIAPFVTSYDSFVIIGEYLKRQDNSCKIYAGGHFASLNKEYLLQKNKWLEGIIVGEGENTLLEILENGGKKNLAGLYTEISQQNFQSQKRIMNLDSLPFQARYLRTQDLAGQPMAITTSRGCYGNCSFCSISKFYELNSPEIKQTYRSASAVADEIFELRKNYGVTHIKIVDDNFFRADDNLFLEELTKLLSGLEIKFRLSARPNDITEKRAKFLKKMGAEIVAIGAESADEKSLKLFNKGIGIDCSERAIKILTENNISCLINFIMFNPILDLAGLKANYSFVAKYSKQGIFHRINSHLWIRATDDLTNTLEKIGLCERLGFPYMKCKYLYPEIQHLKTLFDKWCAVGMKKYYSYADILMAKGLHGNLETYKNYVAILEKDLEILGQLISMLEQNRLEYDGENYIAQEIERFEDENIFA